MVEEEMLKNSIALEIVQRRFEEARSRNPRLSMRAYAQKLGLSSGALSELLQGKRQLTLQLKKKIAPKLQLSPKEEMDFFNEDLPSPLRPQRLEYLKLSADQFHLISDWWHYAILNLLKTRDFKPEKHWMARRLGLPLQVVADAWERLFRLGHLVQIKEQIRRRHPKIESSDGHFDVSVRKSHLGDLPLIENSLLEIPIAWRDHTSVTIAMSKKDLPQAKETIRLFQDQFIQKYEKQSADEVYRLSMSLFPLTEVMEEQ